jgi:hypothetical protein
VVRAFVASLAARPDATLAVHPENRNSFVNFGASRERGQARNLELPDNLVTLTGNIRSANRLAFKIC